MYAARRKKLKVYINIARNRYKYKICNRAASKVYRRNSVERRVARGKCLSSLRNFDRKKIGKNKKDNVEKLSVVIQPTPYVSTYARQVHKDINAALDSISSRANCNSIDSRRIITYANAGCVRIYARVCTPACPNNA